MRKCPVCQTEFQPRSGTHLHCSDKCCKRAWRNSPKGKAWWKAYIATGKYKECQKRYVEANSEKIREKNWERAKRYRKEHPSEWAEYMTEWRKRNPEKVRDSKKRYYKKHRKEILEKTSAYQKAHPEKVRAHGKAHRERHPERVREQRRESARRSHAERPEKYREACKRYRERHPGRCRKSEQKSARKRRTEQQALSELVLPLKLEERLRGRIVEAKG